jgi:hypothetical protein
VSEYRIINKPGIESRNLDASSNESAESKFSSDKYCFHDANTDSSIHYDFEPYPKLIEENEMHSQKYELYGISSMMKSILVPSLPTISLPLDIIPLPENGWALSDG